MHKTIALFAGFFGFASVAVGTSFAAAPHTIRSITHPVHFDTADVGTYIHPFFIPPIHPSQLTVNFGASNTDTHADSMTLGLGARIRITGGIDADATYEFPHTRHTHKHTPSEEWGFRLKSRKLFLTLSLQESTAGW